MILLKPLLLEIAAVPAYRAMAIFFSTYLIWGVGSLVVMVGIRSHHYWMLMESLIAVSSVWLIQQVIGMIWFRQRPFVHDPTIPNLIHKSGISKSFPSDHAAIAFALATIVFLTLPGWGKVLYVLAFAIALGRIAVGVHYPSDVLAGALLGALVATLIHWIGQRI